VESDFKCSPFALHPLGTTQFDLPVVGTLYAPSLPPQPEGWPQRACHEARGVTVSAVGTPEVAGGTAVGGGAATVGGGGYRGCSVCGFVRYADVDNAAVQRRKPALGYGLSEVQMATPSLAACEAACCDEPLCNSVVWLGNASRCVASLAIAHGARKTDWCWHPSAYQSAVTSLRLPGSWEAHAVELGEQVVVAREIVRQRSPFDGATAPAALYRKAMWTHPQGHYGRGGRVKQEVSCTARGASKGHAGTVELSALAADAIPTERGRGARLACHTRTE